MKTLLETHACKATAAGTLAVVILAWPPALAWLVATAALAYAMKQFGESFAALDAQQPTATTTVVEAPVNGEAHNSVRSVDMDELIATLAARTATPKTR
jgi:hypothetical protein